MSSPDNVYENLVVGDLYHWEMDPAGKIAVLPNIRERMPEAGEV